MKPLLLAIISSILVGGVIYWLVICNWPAWLCWILGILAIIVLLCIILMAIAYYVWNDIKKQHGIDSVEEFLVFLYKTMWKIVSEPFKAAGQMVINFIKNVLN